MKAKGLATQIRHNILEKYGSQLDYLKKVLNPKYTTEYHQSCYWKLEKLCYYSKPAMRELSTKTHGTRTPLLREATKRPKINVMAALQQRCFKSDASVHFTNVLQYAANCTELGFKEE